MKNNFKSVVNEIKKNAVAEKKVDGNLRREENSKGKIQKERGQSNGPNGDEETSVVWDGQ